MEFIKTSNKNIKKLIVRCFFEFLGTDHYSIVMTYDREFGPKFGDFYVLGNEKTTWVFIFQKYGKLKLFTRSFHQA